jgi:lysylphosphatidylglycerol synthetase-like protein (DUF2156 family)
MSARSEDVSTAVMQALRAVRGIQAKFGEAAVMDEQDQIISMRSYPERGLTRTEQAKLAFILMFNLILYVTVAFAAIVVCSMHVVEPVETLPGVSWFDTSFPRTPAKQVHARCPFERNRLLAFSVCLYVFAVLARLLYRHMRYRDRCGTLMRLATALPLGGFVYNVYGRYVTDSHI